MPQIYCISVCVPYVDMLYTEKKIFYPLPRRTNFCPSWCYLTSFKNACLRESLLVHGLRCKANMFLDLLDDLWEVSYLFLSRNIPDFMKIIYLTPSAIWNLTTTHGLSQKTIKIDVKKPVHWNRFTLLIGDLLVRHF